MRITRLFGCLLALVITGCTSDPQAMFPTASSAAAVREPTVDMADTATSEMLPIVADRPTVTLVPTASEIPPSPTLPQLTIQARDFGNATARYDPDIDALLLANGYEANIISVGDRRGLRASQRSYTTSTWTRDLDYAISGYSYVLGDMRVLRENIELFLLRVDADGLAPETIYLRGDGLYYENRQAWDSLPNLIHAVYVYVAKTGDRDFYANNRETVQQIGMRMVRMDSDGDGLPDGDDWPYGYYDSLYNSVMHTYAIARFYATYRELAELERLVAQNGDVWDERATRLRAGFHRPFEQGGYWLANQAWPIAWRTADGTPVTMLESYSVFAALRSGLIDPSDGARYQNLVATLHDRLPELIDGPSPMRLALGGYEPEMRREVDPPVPLWMLDASAPWISGLAAPAYAQVGYPEDAFKVMQAYAAMARATDPPVLEFVAGPDARYGPGNSGDGGRTWDSAAWFMAIYGGHYGITFTPAALVVRPYPFAEIAGDGVQNLSYQGAYVQLALDTPQNSYRIQADRPINVRLLPMGDAQTMQINGGPAQSEVTLQLEPGVEYTVVSEGGSGHQSDVPDNPTPANGAFGDPAFRRTWQRTDLPVAANAPGLAARSWIWGDQPLTGGFRERYVDAPGETRRVQYFDKSRMEITWPDAVRNQWYVTNGLLVVEMISGQMQIGDTTFAARTPADVAVAGDPEQSNPDAPTYRSFRSVAYPMVTQPAPRRTGQIVTSVLTRDGSVSDDPTLARYGVVLDTYDEQLGHNIPRVFSTFFDLQGIVYVDSRYMQDRIIDWLFVMGLPISEPYWARVQVGGVERDVLMQAFERRVVTYTPANDPAWRVEMGNLGQHYLRWRYQ